MRNTNRVIRPLGLLFLLCVVPLWTFAQTIAVTGVVNDPLGEPVIGASVLEQGTTNGTITDIDGNFKLNVSPQANIVISFISYQSQTIKVSGRTQFSVVLADDTRLLDEVVVVGYGTQRREAVTGSVSSMRGDVLQEIQTGNMTSALVGRVAGVQISQTSSKPGADMQIRIRGTRSLSGDNDPLVVLDGIPFAGAIGDINPNDIKNVDILKDASATSIYGSRGANGVIIVTTNKGSKGQQAKVTYDAYVGFKTLYSRYPMMSGDELYELRRAAGIYKEADGTPTLGADERQGVNTDWQDMIFSTAVTTNHNIGITGGTEKSNYNFGLGYLNDASLLPGQDYSRISLRASLDQEIGKYLRFGLTTNNNYNITNGQNLGMYNTLATSPLIDPWNEDGSRKVRVSAIADANSWAYSREAVENLGDQWADKQNGIGSYNSAYGDLKIPGVEGLSYRVTLGLNVRTKNRGTYRGMGVFSDTPTAVSVATLDKSLTTNWMVENLVTYERYLDKHHFTANALYSTEETHYDRSYVRATDIPSDHFQYWNLGQAPSDKITVNPDDQDYEEYGLQSLMARLIYDYDSRYMFLGSYRRDGSSRLAEGHKWIDYFAFSGGWNIGKESFMQSYTWLDELKLRVGWGVTSNQAVRPYATQGRLGIRPYNFGSQMATGFYVSETPNPELGWEFSRTWNVGLDFSILKNRLSGTIEWYTGITNDVIQWVNLPPSGGVGGYYANIGKVKNTGIEVSLNGTILDNVNGWTWDAGINLYANRNEITELATGQERDEGNAWFVGHSINSVYDYEKIGLWQEGDPYLSILEPGGNVGMIKVKYTGEYNADGTPVRQIGAEDKQILNADPDFLGGFNTRVSYKGWDLNVIGTFQSGGLLVSSLHASNGYLNMLTGRRGNVKVDYWTPENTGAKYPKPGGIQSGDNQKYGSTLGYFSATHLKVGSITLGYSFDRMSWIKSLGVSKARLYFTVQNPFVFFSPFNDETGLDPVTNSYGNENAAVTSSLPYNSSTMLTVGTNVPATRNYLFGLSLSF